MKNITKEENSAKKGHEGRIEDTRYYGAIPDKVLEEMTPEIIEQLISTEYVVRRIHRNGGSTLNSIFADIAVQIGDSDIYHIECQMNRDRGMALRMLEYDIHIGLVHGRHLEIENKHLNMLVPFLPIRFRKFLIEK